VTRNENHPSTHQADTERIERWRWMMEQNVPIIGGWMHKRIASALTEAAISGNWLAAQSLAVVFVFHENEEVREVAGETLRRINYATGIDAIWGVWAETRSPGLEEIAVAYRRMANHPASIRLLSALRLGMENEEVLTAVTRGSPELIPPLIQACQDRDARIAQRARQTIVALQNPASIDAVCLAWQANRAPFLTEIIQHTGYIAQKPAETRVLSALRTQQLNVVEGSSVEMVAPLISACSDNDPDIAQAALRCLPRLTNEAAIDEFCRLWSETRSPLLETALLQARYQARCPVSVRVLTALKTGDLAAAQQTTPEGLPVLLQAVQDADPVIQESASAALAHLESEATIDALCNRVIETNDPLAREIALAHQYAPSSPELRALFYFLTDQSEAYDALDFDQSILRAIYEVSPAQLRQRIAERVQKAGRTDYLTILAGLDFRARSEEVTADESALMVRILTANQEFERLWALVSELALPFCLQIIQILKEHNWQPTDEADLPFYEELVRLVERPMQVTGLDTDRALPLAIPRSTLTIKGRVNDVAFSPIRPVVAIATSQRKVVLWNFQNAAVESVLRDFKHSVGKVAFTPQGTLICAERTNNESECVVNTYTPGTPEETHLLFSAHGTVTVLEPIGEDRLLTAGRDKRVILWDLTRNKKISEKEFSFWPRSSAISADLQYAALLHDRLSLVKLPDLSIVPGFPYLLPRSEQFTRGVSQTAAFSPDGKYLLAGQYNGQVGLYYHTSLTQKPRKAVVTQHSQPIRSVHFLAHHPVVLSAGAEGQIRFLHWPDARLMGMVYAPEGQLTTLRVSPQGAFMASGTNDASLVLWDLRVLDIPDLFSRPLATTNHEQVATVMALGEYHSLPEAVRNGLMFLRLLLQYRFRFDIQVEEAPIIQFGEFDILLDEE
jgi:HEAT repeat protein